MAKRTGGALIRVRLGAEATAALKSARKTMTARQAIESALTFTDSGLKRLISFAVTEAMNPQPAPKQMDHRSLAPVADKLSDARAHLSALAKSAEITNHQKRNATLASEAIQRAILAVRFCAHTVNREAGRAELEAMDMIEPRP